MQYVSLKAELPAWRAQHCTKTSVGRCPRFSHHQIVMLRSLQRAFTSAEAVVCSSTQHASLLSASNGVQLPATQQLLQLQQAQQQQMHSCILQVQQQTQQLCSLHTSVTQERRQHFQTSLARHFSSSSSCRSSRRVIAEQLDAVGNLVEQPLKLADIEEKEKRQQELQRQQRLELLASLPGTLYRATMFQNKLSSSIKSRKPAIKFPARHQWEFCAEDYDPMARNPSGPQPLPPYAPLKAYTKRYPKIFHETRPKFHRNSYRRLWRKNMAIADQRWKKNWELKLAAARKEDAAIKRMSERIIRARSWQMWQVQQQDSQRQQQ